MIDEMIDEELQSATSISKNLWDNGFAEKFLVKLGEKESEFESITETNWRKMVKDEKKQKGEEDSESLSEEVKSTTLKKQLFIMIENAIDFHDKVVC